MYYLPTSLDAFLNISMECESDLGRNGVATINWKIREVFWRRWWLNWHLNDRSSYANNIPPFFCTIHFLYLEEHGHLALLPASVLYLFSKWNVLLSWKVFSEQPWFTSGLVPLLWTHLSPIWDVKMALCRCEYLEADTDAEFRVQDVYAGSAFVNGRRRK